MASLENLPAELRLLILDSIDDIASLQCLVQASPIYHASYWKSRKTILLKLVQRQHYEHSLVEPLFALLAISYSLWKPGGDKSLPKFLHNYGRSRECVDTPTSPNYIALFHVPVHLAIIIKVVKLQRAVTRIVDDFCITKLSRAGANVLSPMERRRITQALYRLQILCGLFGCEDQKSQVRGSGLYRSHLPSRVFTQFISRFAPWEVQEIGCMWEYIVTRYSDMLKELGVDDAWRERYVYPTWERQASLEPIEGV